MPAPTGPSSTPPPAGNHSDGHAAAPLAGHHPLDSGSSEAVVFSDLIQDLVLDSTDIGGFLHDVARHAASSLSAPDSEVHCAVLLVRPRMKGTMAGSSPEATAMDEVQFQYDDGPCLRAAREQAPCVVEDFQTDSRFGQYTPAILHAGIRSALGVPIPLEGEAIAALDLYSTRAGEFDAERTQAALHLAAEASRALRTAIRIAHFADTATNLRAAMDSRATIQLAAGIIMGQNRCSHDTAIAILKSASSSRNIKLKDVAAAVVLSIGQQPPAAHFDG
ncbi:response regulator receiver protein [Arthrobacter pityocampae]|uniref:Response regulator receiver protein n=1 Tax=Arthrobacter pityocampae TaxID=547334 RepID=A0A2S5IVH2_9MICC|nr:GAF and ANTAR domain-containing protein [Arthrobacter pityocampae]PPB48531.1 response regulator receiver protein [Arthrobacter pityocampae]